MDTGDQGDKVDKIGAAHKIGKSKVNRKEMRKQMLELKMSTKKLRKNNRHERADKKAIT
jgi:hypothetical protein